jgi:hypothetical protein
MPALPEKPQWPELLERANRSRMLALTTHDPKARTLLLQLAEEYVAKAQDDLEQWNTD